MKRFSLAALKRAIVELHCAGASEFFKTYLTLKRHGLRSDPNSSIVVDTTNTQPGLVDLFMVRRLTDLSDFRERPFYEPFTNTSLMDHAARSIIQTHVKKFHDGKMGDRDLPWLICEQLPDMKWNVKVGHEYPKGLGTGKSGLAQDDDKQICIPTPAFLVWYFRYSEFEEAPKLDQLFERMRSDLNFDESEVVLLFDDKRSFNGFEFSDTLDEKALAEFVANEVSRGAAAITEAQKTLPSGRPRFSDPKVNAIVNTFKPITGESTAFFTPRDSFKEALEILQKNRVLLLVGPPAVGKTRLAFKLASHLLNGDQKRQHNFQFHASYSYEDFVEAMVPKPAEGGGLRFEPEEKPFLRACEAALKEPQVVLIDELNRADVPKVLGEAILLLEPEYRNQKYAVKRIYKPEASFHIPLDLYVIATMNNIDKSTFDIDFAILRRFHQLELAPDPIALARMVREDGCADEQLIRIVCTLLSEVQQFYPLGHGYFKGMRTREDLVVIYRRSIRPAVKLYLGEDRRQELSNVDKIFERAYLSAAWEDFVGSR